MFKNADINGLKYQATYSLSIDVGHGKVTIPVIKGHHMT